MMTLERIAEIEQKCSLVGEVSQWPRTLAELGSLARLGLKVHEAPVVQIGGADSLSAFLINCGKKSLPSMQGKRVALVVLD